MTQNFNAKFKTDLFDRCKKFSLRILQLADEMPDKQGCQIIMNQLMRSATSIGASMTEGRGASSRLELKKFNEIALKSANETRYWLELLRDANFSSAERINPLLIELQELTNMIAAGIMKLKGKL